MWSAAVPDSSAPPRCCPAAWTWIPRSPRGSFLHTVFPTPLTLAHRPPTRHPTRSPARVRPDPGAPPAPPSVVPSPASSGLAGLLQLVSAHSGPETRGGPRLLGPQQPFASQLPSASALCLYPLPGSIWSDRTAALPRTTSTKPPPKLGQLQRVPGTPSRRGPSLPDLQGTQQPCGLRVAVLLLRVPLLLSLIDFSTIGCESGPRGGAQRRNGERFAVRVRFLPSAGHIPMPSSVSLPCAASGMPARSLWGHLVTLWVTSRPLTRLQVTTL